MKKIPLEIGKCVTFSKTVSESDVYLFAGITGDLSPNHVNEQYMSETPYKKRIAHGVLSIGFASTASTMVFDSSERTAVSYGYERIRFVKPIFIGDTITVKYTVKEIDEAKQMSISHVEIVNQDEEVCTVAQHILKFID